MTSSRPLRASRGVLVYSLFFLSGAGALIYEIVWSRLFTFVFGASTAAISTVLAAYMGGLALGSWFWGRRIDRGGRPLVVYAGLEVGVALWALLLPFLLTGLTALLRPLYDPGEAQAPLFALVRFGLSFLLLIVPTALMGGTLPVLGRLPALEGEAVADRLGLLYGFNTLGAVLGAALAGFLLVPGLGLQGATLVAVAFNLLVAAVAFLAFRGVGEAPAAGGAAAPGAERKAAAPVGTIPAGTRPADAAPAHAPQVAPAPATASGAPLLWIYGLGGAAAMIYEVGWTRALATILGTTTYAFTAMLTTFLSGLALGALFGRRLARGGDPAARLAALLLVVALLGLATMPILGQLPVLYVEAWRRLGGDWGRQTLVRFAFCLLIMFPATFAMGALFPLVSRLYARRAERMGRDVGALYGANTLGAIVGSLTAGFLLVPWLGQQRTLLAAGLVYLGAFLLLLGPLWRGLSRRGRGWAAAGLAALVVAGAVAARPWDRYLMASGVYVHAEPYTQIAGRLADVLRGGEMLLYQETSDAVVSVVRVDYEMAVRTNGKGDATSHGDILTQKLLAHLPLAHHPAPRDVAVIGLASGVSLGSALTWPTVRHADCVEIVPAMKRAAALFKAYNHDCLNDPRVRIVENDGRNHLALTTQAYDVIISEPSNPWITGISALFTRDFYRQAQARLRPDGIYCQWVQTYQITREDFGAVLRTFRASFPHVSIWMGSPGDVILLGSRQPLGLDAARLARLRDFPTVRDDLAAADITDTPGFLAAWLGRDATLGRLIPAGDALITDDNLRLEYSMPRHLYDANADFVRLETLRAAREPAAGYLDWRALAPAEADSARRMAARAFMGRDAALQAVALQESRDYAPTLPGLAAALELAPTDPLLLYAFAFARNELGEAALEQGATPAVRADFAAAAARGTRLERARAHRNLGSWWQASGRPDSARVEFETALRLEPALRSARDELSALPPRHH